METSDINANHCGQTVRYSRTMRAFQIGSKTIEIPKYELDETDSVVIQLRASYPNLRLWLPGDMGTTDHDPTRFNVHFSFSEGSDHLTITSTLWG